MDLASAFFLIWTKHRGVVLSKAAFYVARSNYSTSRPFASCVTDKRHKLVSRVHPLWWPVIGSLRRNLNAF